ncbi:MAG: hypothetical protein JRD47_09555 [Deltaproteobacteria bacterium]|nr:hypothetical protein [Deltaproteobacteria bacterium]MBW2602149.1 hypothetical protein [Deltaproteobacteria bacterium]
MVQKHLICPQRIRKIPKQFSWLDHRLVRDHYIERCSHSAAALYLFLVTVADAQGLSYYSERVISQRLDMDANTLAQTRKELIRIGLIAYQKPLYQVLALDTLIEATNRYPGQLQSLAQIFKQIGEGAS